MGRKTYKKARHAKDPRLKQPYTRETMPSGIVRHVKHLLRRRTLRTKRERLYAQLAKRGRGQVLCFVCGKHVSWAEATLEHIQPLSKGGTDAWRNLAISHELCNQARGNDWQTPRETEYTLTNSGS